MASLDRLVKAFAALARKALEQVAYSGTWPYSVESCNPETQTVSARSLDPRMPDLTDIPFATPGLFLNLPPGTQIRVAFTALGDQGYYVATCASGGIPSTPPGAGSGITNNVHAGYILIVQAPATPFTVLATYFPAGIAGRLAAETAHTAAPGSILLELNGGRIMADAWTVP